MSSHEFDVVDVHTRQAPLALAVASGRVRRLVLTPCASAEGLLGGPHTRATRAMLAAAPRIVCRSELERDLLCGSIPGAASRAVVVPDGVQLEALYTAQPFATEGIVVLAVDRLDRATGVGRAIAAMASLDPEFRLVIVGDGPARDRLRAFADDLRVSSRIQFTGAVSDADLHRWLRTARVVVSLPGERSSGTAVTEACAAGVSVVASDLPIQRHAAERVGGGVIFVPPRGSPLDVADAIEEASRLSVIRIQRCSLPRHRPGNRPSTPRGSSIATSSTPHARMSGSSPCARSTSRRNSRPGASPWPCRHRSSWRRPQAGQPTNRRGGRLAVGQIIG